MKCPNCGVEDQTGKYCAECGAGLDVSCPACGDPVPPGARFCTSCGEPVAAGGGDGRSMTPWVIAAAALLVVVVLLFLPRQADRVPAPPPGGTQAPLTGAGSAPGGGLGELSPDMRTNADRLFNRIMAAAEEGNRADVERFMPMAIQAYGMVEELNEDGLYHLGILHLTAGDHAEARRVAQQLLDRHPDHILALGVAASAEAEAGDTAAAEVLWQRLLDAYPEESARPLPEYLDHQIMLGEYQRAAEEALGA